MTLSQRLLFVDSSISTKRMYQNYLIIEHSQNKSSCYGYQHLWPRCHLQGATPIEVSVTSTHHLWTLWVDLLRSIDNSCPFRTYWGLRFRRSQIYLFFDILSIPKLTILSLWIWSLADACKNRLLKSLSSCHLQKNNVELRFIAKFKLC